MASAGYDPATADLQHGAFDCHAMRDMFQAVRASGAAPMARMPWLDAGAVMKALDAGAYGVICLMVNSRAEAECLVSHVRHPPYGTRSFGPTRANFSAGPNYGEEADGNVICLAMIETRDAFDRVEEIAATPGLDGLYVGPADLTLGLTGRKYRAGFDRKEPEMVEAPHRVRDAAHAAGAGASAKPRSPEVRPRSRREPGSTDRAARPRRRRPTVARGIVARLTVNDGPLITKGNAGNCGFAAFPH